MERTLVLIKPDAIQRGLTGRIVARFEEKGLKLASVKFMRLNDELLNEHYSHLLDNAPSQRVAASLGLIHLSDEVEYM